MSPREKDQKKKKKKKPQTLWVGLPWNIPRAYVHQLRQKREQNVSLRKKKKKKWQKNSDLKKNLFGCLVPRGRSTPWSNKCPPRFPTPWSGGPHGIKGSLKLSLDLSHALESPFYLVRLTNLGVTLLKLSSINPSLGQLPRPRAPWSPTLWARGACQLKQRRGGEWAKELEREKNIETK